MDKVRNRCFADMSAEKVASAAMTFKRRHVRQSPGGRKKKKKTKNCGQRQSRTPWFQQKQNHVWAEKKPLRECRSYNTLVLKEKVTFAPCEHVASRLAEIQQAGEVFLKSSWDTQEQPTHSASNQAHIQTSTMHVVHATPSTCFRLAQTKVDSKAQKTTASSFRAILGLFDLA